MDSVGLVSQPWMGRCRLPGSVQPKLPELPAAFCEPVLVCLHLLQEDCSPTTSWEPWMRQGLCPAAPVLHPGAVLGLVWFSSDAGVPRCPASGPLRAKPLGGAEPQV